MVAVIAEDRAAASLKKTICDVCFQSCEKGKHLEGCNLMNQNTESKEGCNLVPFRIPAGMTGCLQIDDIGMSANIKKIYLAKNLCKSFH